MDYKSHRDKIIERATNRSFGGYTERHHIVPRCMGGTDDPENIVRLTPEEHYVVHQLLVKIYPEVDGLVRAAHLMSRNSNGQRSNNKTYGWLRKRFSMQQSRFMQGNTINKGRRQTLEAVRNAAAGRRGTKRSAETKQKMSDAHKNRIYKPLTEEHKHNISLASTGRKHTLETKAKISAANTGRPSTQKGVPQTQEHIQKRVTALTGRKRKPFSDEWRRNMSKGKIGHTSGMTGKTHSAQTKDKMSASHLGIKTGRQRIVICPSCEKHGGVANMKRYHFDNCKKKTNAG